MNGYDDQSIAGLWDAEESSADNGSPQGNNLVVCDLSDIYFHLGPAKFRTLLPRLLDAAKTRGVSLVGIVNSCLIAEDCRVWLEGASDGIVRIWDDEYCRFAQVVKGIGRKRHQPRLLIESDEPPFFELV